MDKILARSAEFENVMYDYFTLPSMDSSPKAELARRVCFISFEHAQSLKMLLATRNFTSAIALLRLQYECYVRGVWIYYAANEDWIGKLNTILTHESDIAAQKLPLLTAMLKDLENKAPQNALLPIIEFKEYSWKPLSSYVHGGLHAIDRHKRGYPIEILKMALMASNGVSGMAAMFGAVLSGHQGNVSSVSNTYYQFADCLNFKHAEQL